MTTSIQRTLTTTFAALTLGAGLLAAAAPAQAKGFKHHGHGGFIAAGVLGGLALGAIAASSYPAYGYGAPVVYAPSCYRVRQPVTDIYGNVVGYQRVRVCE